jgi:hypothetical protein
MKGKDKDLLRLLSLDLDDVLLRCIIYLFRSITLYSIKKNPTINYYCFELFCQHCFDSN